MFGGKKYLPGSSDFYWIFFSIRTETPTEKIFKNQINKEFSCIIQVQCQQKQCLYVIFCQRVDIKSPAAKSWSVIGVPLPTDVPKITTTEHSLQPSTSHTRRLERLIWCVYDLLVVHVYISITWHYTEMLMFWLNSN